MRRLIPSLPIRVQLRRNRKTIKVAPALIVQSKRDWIAIIGSMASVITSILVAVVVAGPDNVRNIPKIPSVAYDTLQEALASKRLDWELTGKWTANVPARLGVPAYKMILEMQTSDGASRGMMTTPASIPWSRSQFTDFEGKKNGEFVELEFWGFVFGERKSFAKSRIRIFPEPCPSVCEDQSIDYARLTMETYWQSSVVLPKTHPFKGS